MKGVTKRFPGVLANYRVDFDVRAGEVHALLGGETGRCKSTLMKVLYGMNAPDEGEIWLNGQAGDHHLADRRHRHGIGMIHQHFMLVETLTVAENVALGLPSSRGPLTDWTAYPSASRIGGGLRPAGGTQPYIWQLAVGQKQRVEILQGVCTGRRLLILDEPDSRAHTTGGRRVLYHAMRQMTREDTPSSLSRTNCMSAGHLQRVTVLRDGKRVTVAVLMAAPRRAWRR